MKTVCVVGNFSGRNAGDAAILDGLLHSVYPLNQDVRFLVPTINKRFVEKTYNKFPVTAVSLMPWNLSFKIFGLPILTSILKSDLILLTDAILFDKDLLNPVHNYLFTMALVLPMAKRKNIPVVLYNVSLGPITSSLGGLCMTKVIESSDIVILRDPSESKPLLESLKLTPKEMHVGADCALNIHLPQKERIRQINETEGIFDVPGEYISFNVSTYLDVFVRGKKKGIGHERFIKIISETMDWITGSLKKKIVFVITQPMDLKIADLVLNALQNRKEVTLVSNKTYSHNEIAGILSQVEMHIGMRTHSLIFATSSCVPTIGIIATQKNRGYMRTIEQDDRMIEFGDSFTAENLKALILDTWNNRQVIREQLSSIVKREKGKASGGSKYLEKYL